MSAGGGPRSGAGPGSEEPAGQLEAETGTLGWAELARHFARGVVIVVSPGLDLITVAGAMARDEARAVRSLIDEGTLTRATDQHARAWVAGDPVFRCVVVAPWVLVQPLH